MYLTITIYAICLALIIWGASFAGFGNSFHDDFMSLEKTKAIRGLAALCVLFHHISQEAVLQEHGVMSGFVNAGPQLVSIFFFCSGYGLIKALDSKPGYLNGFLRKRVINGLVITFYVNILLYAIFHLAMREQIPVMRWVFNFTGLTLMNEYAWYPIVLVFLYLAFYLIFKHVKNRKAGLALMLLAIILQGVLFSVGGHFAWWAGRRNWWLNPFGFAKASWWMQEKTIWFNGQWWVNSSIGMFVGMLFAQYEKSIVGWFRRLYWLKLAIVAILTWVTHALSVWTQANVGYYTEWSGNGPGIMEKFITYLSQLPEISMWVLLVFILGMKLSISNPVTKFFGKYSLDTYMMNLIAITVFRFLLDKGEKFYGVYAAAVVVATIAMALIEFYIVKVIKDRLRKTEE